MFGQVTRVLRIESGQPDIRAILMECTELPPYSDAVRHETKLPVYDAMMGVPNYGAPTAKAALELLGVLDNRHVRSPLVALDDDEVADLRAGLVAADLL